MKLGDIESKKLLPRFAHDSEWVQLAFDVIVKNVYGRSKSIDAPLTLEAIQALTDEELQVLYDQFGIVKYYPDLSRETRDKMLFELARLYRYLGTPKAIETLCKYIFDGIDLNVKIEDNKAFDEFGNLVRPDLIDTFDAIVSLNEPSLGTNSNARILENVINFSRNSQYLNGIDYDFSEVFTVYVSIAINDNNPACTIDILNDVICEPVTPPVPQTALAYIIVDEDTGEIVFSQNDPSMVFSQVGHIEMPDSDMIFCIELGVPVESFYFTTNGRNETENTNISHADIPVYLEDGTAPAADTPYDGSPVLAFMDVTGNTKQANGESLYVDDGELRLDAPDTDEGEQWAALVEKVFPDILTLWAKITDNSEKMYLQTRVINTSTPNSTYLYALYTDEALTQRFVIDSNKTYELGVFKGQNFAPYDIQDVSQMPSTTVSGSGAVSGFLLVDQSGAYLWAATNNTYSTYVNAPGNKLSFKCRVSEPPAPSLPTISTVTAYLNTPGSSSGTLCNFGDRLAIKDSNDTQMSYDSSKFYIIYVNTSNTSTGTKTMTRLGYICFNDSTGLLYAYNRGAAPKYCHDCTLYVCDSNQAARVVVQSSSNVKYSAFLMDGYYYVCDGVQTDWTDDLSSIGYSVLQGDNAYLTASGSSGTTDTSTGNTGYNLYNASGVRIAADSSKYYVIIAQYLYDGTDVTTYNMNTSGLTSSYIRVEYSKLNYAGGSSGGLVYRVVYTIE